MNDKIRCHKCKRYFDEAMYLYPAHNARGRYYCMKCGNDELKRNPDLKRSKGVIRP